MSAASPLAATEDTPPASETSALLGTETHNRHVARFSRKRFWWLCGLGVAALVTLQLFFLPRTSPNRDFRRWHNLHLTKTDVKRIFLVQSSLGHPDKNGGTVESNARAWLDEFSAINAKSPASVAASAAPRLAAYMEKSMRALAATETHEYPLPASLRAPVSSELQLVDEKSNRVLYSSQPLEPGFATPAFFLYSQNGSVEAKPVYVNGGFPADFALLETNSISVQGRIVIFLHSLTSTYALHDKISMAESLGAAGVVVYGTSELNTAISRNFKPLSPPKEAFRLPVSYECIKPVLGAIGSSSGAFAAWKFAPVPSDDSLKMRISCHFSPEPLSATNIVAKIDGALQDSEIVIGASRDVLTAASPSSGSAVLLEIMRRFRSLQQLGWVPLRTIRFVSWDASRSGALGSKASARDPDVFKANMPILAYIDLDDDLVTGSHLTVDANPVFNHIVENSSRFIPFPRNSTYYKRLCEVEDSAEGIASNYDETSLHDYWKKQDGAHINNKLGYSFAGKDSATFQMLMDAPSISVKYTPSPKYNDSVYVPESNAYSLRWVKTELDQNMDLHASAVRFIGLIVLSLTEHEVVDSRTKPYFAKARDFFGEFEDNNRETLGQMEAVTAEWPFYERSVLFDDLKEKNGNDVHTVGEILQQMESLLAEVVEQASVFDAYNQDVEVLWATDFPWYKMLRKMHIFAKFKVSNYKLLRMEKELGRPEEEQDFDMEPEYHHFMYDLAQGAQPIKTKQERGAFGAFYNAADARDVETLVRLMVAKYERLKSVYRHMT